jgi:hypothetical protein
MAGMPYLLLGGFGVWLYRSMKSAQLEAADEDSDPGSQPPA